MKKRLFILLAVLILCLAGLTLTASAATELTQESILKGASGFDSTNKRLNLTGGPTGGSYQLTEDITLYDSASGNAKYIRFIKGSSSSKTFTLDLNGYVLKTNGEDCAIRVDEDVTLILIDTNSSRTHTGDNAALPKGGVITGNTGTNSMGLVKIDGNASTTFTMKGGTLYAGCANGTNSAGGVCVKYGTFRMEGGKISHCTATNSTGTAGGVLVRSDGKFYMSGGEISDCSGKNGSNSGDAVYNLGTMYADGGTISSAVKNNGTLTRSADATGLTTFSAGVSGEAADDAAKLTVTFSNDGQTTTKKVFKGQTVIEPPVTKEGHTLDGWYDGNTKWIFSTAVTKDMTLTAEWKINQYTITFNTNGGSDIDPITQNYGTAITAPANPSRQGYTFGRWSETIPATMPARDMTIRVYWEPNTNTPYTAKYYYMDTDGTYPATPDLTEPKNGMTDSSVGFDALATAGGKTGFTLDDTRSSSAYATIAPTGDTVVELYYARKTVTLTFNTDGGNLIPPITGLYGTAVTPPADPEKEYYTFQGWNFVIPSTMPDEGYTITAQWKGNEYRVTLHTNGATSCEALTTYTYGVGATLPTPTRTGYAFGGWYDDVTMEWDAVTAISATDSGPKGFYAKWIPNAYTVTFDKNANEATGTMAKQSFTYDESAKALTACGYTRPGYTFAGWQYGGQTYADGQSVQNLTATNNATLTFAAQWTANDDTAYVIETYRMDTEGNYPATPSSSAPKTGTTDTSATVPQHSEAGWRVDSDCSVLTGNIDGNGTLVLKLYLARNRYTVTFVDGYSDTVLSATSDYFGATVAEVAEPTRTSYVFAGWYDGNTKYTFPLTVPAQDLTLTACWTPVVPGHGVQIAPTEHGTLSVWPEAATPGATITITVTPDYGYQFAELTALDASGKALSLTNLGNGKYRFDMPDSAVTVSAEFMEGNRFADVPVGCYYEAAVRWAVENGITSGLDATRFGANATCTRAQLVTFLWRAAGCPAGSGAMRFADVDESAYYAEAVRWAAGLGLVTGYGDGLFGAADPMTREQMAAILYRYAAAMGRDVSVGEDTNILSYEDAFAVSEYAVGAFQWACGAGIVQGANGRLSPRASCTRAQIVVMLYRLLGE